MDASVESATARHTHRRRTTLCLGMQHIAWQMAVLAWSSIQQSNTLIYNAKPLVSADTQTPMPSTAVLLAVSSSRTTYEARRQLKHLRLYSCPLLVLHQPINLFRLHRAHLSRSSRAQSAGLSLCGGAQASDRRRAIRTLKCRKLKQHRNLLNRPWRPTAGYLRYPNHRHRSCRILPGLATRLRKNRTQQLGSVMHRQCRHLVASTSASSMTHLPAVPPPGLWRQMLQLRA